MFLHNFIYKNASAKSTLIASDFVQFYYESRAFKGMRNEIPTRTFAKSFIEMD